MGDVTLLVGEVPVLVRDVPLIVGDVPFPRADAAELNEKRERAIQFSYVEILYKGHLIEMHHKTII